MKKNSGLVLVIINKVKKSKLFKKFSENPEIIGGVPTIFHLKDLKSILGSVILRTEEIKK